VDAWCSFVVRRRFSHGICGRGGAEAGGSSFGLLAEAIAMTEYIEECEKGHFFKGAHKHETCPVSWGEGLVCGAKVIESRPIRETEGPKDT